MSDLAERLRLYRKREDLSQEDIARALDVNSRTIGRIENGQTKPHPVLRAQLERLVATPPSDAPSVTLLAQNGSGKSVVLGVLRLAEGMARAIFGHEPPIRAAPVIELQGPGAASTPSAAPSLPGSPSPGDISASPSSTKSPTADSRPAPRPARRQPKAKDRRPR